FLAQPFCLLARSADRRRRWRLRLRAFDRTQTAGEVGTRAAPSADIAARCLYHCRSYAIASVSIGRDARNSFASVISHTGRAKWAAKKLVSGSGAMPACALISHLPNFSITRASFAVRLRWSVN